MQLLNTILKKNISEINFYVFGVIKHIYYHISLYNFYNKIESNFLKYIWLSIESNYLSVLRCCSTIWAAIVSFPIL